MAKAKKMVKGSSLANMLQVATENLSIVVKNGEVAANSLAKDRKKLLAENKRLSKQRAMLSRKKKTVANQLKKMPNAENRKMLGSIKKELAAVKTAGDKSRAAVAVNTEELNAVKTPLKQASVYMSAIEKADKQLNKPKKKRRVKRVAKLMLVAA